MKNLKFKKALVTGGAGFIGSHLVDKLVEEDYRVAVIDNLSTGRRENLNPKAKFYKIDIRSKKISQVFKKEKPEIVFHLASQIDVKKSLENPVLDAEVNILGSLNLLKNCRKFKIKKFIFTSSVGVYGETKNLPVKENYPLNPISPYSISKLAIEKYLDYYQLQGLDCVSLRYSNVYGPRQRSFREGGVVSIFIDKLIGGKRPVIFGTGLQTRDFLYVDDAVRAAVLALGAKGGSVYNVGTNKEINIKGLLELLNKKSRPVFLPLRQGEIGKSRSDYSRIKKDLGFRPKYSLKQGLKKTLKWFKNKI